MTALETIRDDIKAVLAQIEAQIIATQAPEPAPVIPPTAGQLAWGAKVSPTFRDRVRWIGQDLKFDPNWLMACMAFETGRTFSPKVKNPGSSATGLIQFMNATAAELETTTAALASMTAEDQLNYVWKYFSKRIAAKGPITRLADCYMAILNPAAMGLPDASVMWVQGSSAYAVNAGLDANGDHAITKAETAARVAAMLAEGLAQGNIA